MLLAQHSRWWSRGTAHSSLLQPEQSRQPLPLREQTVYQKWNRLHCPIRLEVNNLNHEPPKRWSNVGTIAGFFNAGERFRARGGPNAGGRLTAPEQTCDGIPNVKDALEWLVRRTARKIGLGRRGCHWLLHANLMVRPEERLSRRGGQEGHLRSRPDPTVWILAPAALSA